tara:strand:+ start:66 stop:968 length:903 start_codon:yes stop_codon:yes gene_type:complete
LSKVRPQEGRWECITPPQTFCRKRARAGDPTLDRIEGKNHGRGMKEGVLAGDGSKEEPFIIYAHDHRTSVLLQRKQIDQIAGQGAYAVSQRKYHYSPNGSEGNHDLCEYLIDHEVLRSSVWFDLHIVEQLSRTPDGKKYRDHVLQQHCSPREREQRKEPVVRPIEIDEHSEYAACKAIYRYLEPYLSSGWEPQSSVCLADGYRNEYVLKRDNETVQLEFDLMPMRHLLGPKFTLWSMGLTRTGIIGVRDSAIHFNDPVAIADQNFYERYLVQPIAFILGPILAVGLIWFVISSLDKCTGK